MGGQIERERLPRREVLQRYVDVIVNRARLLLLLIGHRNLAVGDLEFTQSDAATGLRRSCRLRFGRLSWLGRSLIRWSGRAGHGREVPDALRVTDQLNPGTLHLQAIDFDILGE